MFFGVCAPVVPPVVSDVTVPFSDVNLDFEVVFSDSDWEFVEPQTCSVPSKRKASVVLESETKTKM